MLCVLNFDDLHITFIEIMSMVTMACVLHICVCFHSHFEFCQNKPPLLILSCFKYHIWVCGFIILDVTYLVVHVWSRRYDTPVRMF